MVYRMLSRKQSLFLSQNLLLLIYYPKNNCYETKYMTNITIFIVSREIVFSFIVVKHTINTNFKFVFNNYIKKTIMKF